jgi:hypothetical protein
LWVKEVLLAYITLQNMFPCHSSKAGQDANQGLALAFDLFVLYAITARALKLSLTIEKTIKEWNFCSIDAVSVVLPLNSA